MSSAGEALNLPRLERVRVPLLWIAAVRIVVGIAAIPLAAVLYEDHFLVLLLMRPTKEVMLFGGFLASEGKVHLLQLIAVATPLAIFGVWIAYALGRLYTDEICDEKLPGLAGRILHPDRIKVMQRALKRRGTKLVFLGRIAVFPSSLLASAAGAAKIPPRRFLPVDALGGLASIAEVIGAGYLLGDAYARGKGWVTAAGLVALVGFALVLGRSLRRAGKSKS